MPKGEDLSNGNITKTQEDNREMVNSMYLFLKVVNILSTAQFESVRDMHERLYQIAALTGVDLQKTVEQMAKSDRLKETAIESMENVKLIQKNPTGRGYRIVPGMESEYYAKIFEMRYNREIAKSARDTAVICRKISKLAIIKKIADFSNIDIKGLLMDVIGKAIPDRDGEGNQSTADNMATKSNADRANALQEAAKAVPVLDEKGAELLLDISKAIGKDVADTAKIKDIFFDRLFNTGIEIYDSYLEADREIRGKNAPKVTIDMLSPDKQEEFKGINPGKFVSLMNGLKMFAETLIVETRAGFVFRNVENIREGRGVLGYIAQKNKGFSEKAENVLMKFDKVLSPDKEDKAKGNFLTRTLRNKAEKTVSRFILRNEENDGKENREAQDKKEAPDSSSKVPSKAPDKLGDINEDFDRLMKKTMYETEMEIMDYNRDHRKSWDRGMNFAMCMRGMNVFRCGISEYIPGWCRALHMTKADSAYSFAYMLTYMKPTIDGVVLSKDKVRDTDRYFKQLDAIKSGDRLEKIAKQLEDEFVKAHRDAVIEVAKMRDEAQLPQLSYQEHFNPLFNNPTMKAKPFQYEEMDMATWKSGKTDVEAIYKEKEGIVVHYKDTLVGLFKNEDNGIVALKDRVSGLAKDMLSFVTSRSQMFNDSKDICENQFTVCSHGIMVKDFVKDEPNSGRRPHLDKFLNEYYKMGYEVKKAYSENREYIIKDPLFKESFTINKDTFISKDHEPTEVSNFVERIKDRIGDKLMAEAGISKNAAFDMQYNARKVSLKPNGKYMRDPYLGKAKTLDQMFSKIRQECKDDILDPKKRQEAINDLKKIGIVAPTKEEEQHFYDRLEANRILARTDPQLAACRMIDESFERDGDMIKGQCCGTEFTIEADGNVAIEGRLTDQRAMEVLQELYEIADSFSRNDGKGLDDPGIEH